MLLQVIGCTCLGRDHPVQLSANTKVNYCSRYIIQSVNYNSDLKETYKNSTTGWSRIRGRALPSLAAPGAGLGKKPTFPAAGEEVPGLQDPGHPQVRGTEVV